MIICNFLLKTLWFYRDQLPTGERHRYFKFVIELAMMIYNRYFNKKYWAVLHIIFLLYIDLSIICAFFLFTSTICWLVIQQIMNSSPMSLNFLRYLNPLSVNLTGFSSYEMKITHKSGFLLKTDYQSIWYFVLGYPSILLLLPSGAWFNIADRFIDFLRVLVCGDFFQCLIHCLLCLNALSLLSCWRLLHHNASNSAEVWERQIRRIDWLPLWTVAPSSSLYLYVSLSLCFGAMIDEG